MNTIIEEIRKRIKAASDNTDEAGDYDEYASGQSVGLATALQIIDEVKKEQSATAMNQDEIKSCQELYYDIDSCIEALIKARTEHNQEDEGKALFRMEGLMVAALQQLAYFIDKPVPEDVQEAANQYIAFLGQVNLDDRFGELAEILQRYGAMPAPKEQPEEDLEAEIERWWNERYAKLKKDYKFAEMSGHYIDNEGIIDLARHFAEWGKGRIENAIRLAWGKVSKDPFNVDSAFEELLSKVK